MKLATSDQQGRHLGAHISRGIQVDSGLANGAVPVLAGPNAGAKPCPKAGIAAAANITHKTQFHRGTSTIFSLSWFRRQPQTKLRPLHVGRKGYREIGFCEIVRGARPCRLGKGREGLPKFSEMRRNATVDQPKTDNAARVYRPAQWSPITIVGPPRRMRQSTFAPTCRASAWEAGYAVFSQQRWDTSDPLRFAIPAPATPPHFANPTPLSRTNIPVVAVPDCLRWPHCCAAACFFIE
jgi:hypothetical protein